MSGIRRIPPPGDWTPLLREVDEIADLGEDEADGDLPLPEWVPEMVREVRPSDWTRLLESEEDGDAEGTN